MTRIAHVNAAQRLEALRAMPNKGRTRLAPLALAAAMVCAGAAHAQSPAATTAIGKDTAQTISITG